MKKLVYLISPNKIDQNFFTNLDKVLSFKNVKFFQLRLKNLSQKKLLNFSKRVIKITTKHKVKFIINDNFILASKINADGCHMGQHDGSFLKARKKLKNKIIINDKIYLMFSCNFFYLFGYIKKFLLTYIF